MTLNHALLFGITTGIAGSSLLAVMVNEYAAALAFGNILLYTLVSQLFRALFKESNNLFSVMLGIHAP